MHLRLPFALAMTAAVAASALLLPAVPGTADAAPPPKAPSCKFISQTLNPGQKWQGHTCKWKYGCDCNIKACKSPSNYRWVPQPGTGNCINLPG